MEDGSSVSSNENNNRVSHVVTARQMMDFGLKLHYTDARIERTMRTSNMTSIVIMYVKKSRQVILSHFESEG